MRICFLTTSYPRWPGDSAGVFVASLAEALTERGHTLTVLVPAAAGTHDVFSPQVQIRRIKYWWPLWAGRIAYGSGVLENFRQVAPWVQLPFFIVAANIALWRYARHADMIHIHWWQNAALVMPVLSIIRRPLVITVHGSDVLQLSQHGLKILLARTVCHRAQRIIAVSNDMRTRLINLGIPPNKISTIPNGVPDAATLLQLPTSDAFQGRCLTVGRLIPVKNQAMMLKAFSNLVSDMPTATLTIIGDGPLRAQLVAQAEMLGIDNQVFFRGQGDRQIVLEALATTDIFLLSSRYEGFGLAALEAMAAGKPVIATLVGGIPDFIHQDQTGILVPVDDSQVMADALRRLFRDAQLRRHLGQSARRLVQEQYVWPLVARETEKIYERAI